MTSGADHLTANLEHWELVYWSSKTNLQRTQSMQCYPTTVQLQTFRRLDENIPGHPKIRHLHLMFLWDEAVPGSLLEQRISNLLLNVVNKCTKVASVGLPDLCGWSCSSLSTPFLHWRPNTFPASRSETGGLSFLAGSPTDSRSPWTHTPGTWEGAWCTCRTAAQACSGTISCGNTHSPSSTGFQRIVSGVCLALTSWFLPPLWSPHLTCSLLEPSSLPPSDPSTSPPARAQTGRCQPLDPKSAPRGLSPTELLGSANKRWKQL